jgi:hypothetical protein
VPAAQGSLHRLAAHVAYWPKQIRQTALVSSKPLPEKPITQSARHSKALVGVAMQFLPLDDKHLARSLLKWAAAAKFLTIQGRLLAV